VDMEKNTVSTQKNVLSRYFYIPHQLVGFVIGKKGRIINAAKSKTGAQCIIHRLRCKGSVLEIKGTESVVSQCLVYLENCCSLNINVNVLVAFIVDSNESDPVLLCDGGYVGTHVGAMGRAPVLQLVREEFRLREVNFREAEMLPEDADVPGKYEPLSFSYKVSFYDAISGYCNPKNIQIRKIEKYNQEKVNVQAKKL
jgi:hypothetical protein